MNLDFKSAVKCNMHAHTTRSDGSFSVNELCDLYSNKDYKYLAITDHRIYYDAPLIIKELKVLSGCEFNCYLELDQTYYFHLLALKYEEKDGISHDTSPYNKQFFTSIDEVQSLIDVLKSRGNLVFIAHPKHPLIPMEILLKLDFNGFEIYNTKANSDASDYFNKLYEKNQNILVLACDDSHHTYLEEREGLFKSFVKVLVPGKSIPSS